MNTPELDTPITAFQAEAAALALFCLFKQSQHFSICTVDTVAKLLKKQIGGPDYVALQAIHCVNWSDMPPGMPQRVQDKVIELLGVGPLTFDQPPEPAATYKSQTTGGLLKVFRFRK